MMCRQWWRPRRYGSIPEIRVEFDLVRFLFKTNRVATSGGRDGEVGAIVRTLRKERDRARSKEKGAYTLER